MRNARKCAGAAAAGLSSRNERLDRRWTGPAACASFWRVMHVCRGARTGPAPAGGGGMRCLAAAAACSSGPAPQAQLLGELRDGELGKATAAGASLVSAFNAACYAASPAVACLERVRPRLREVASAAIEPAVAVLFAPMGPPHAAHAAGVAAGPVVPPSAAVPFAPILSTYAAAPAHAAGSLRGARRRQAGRGTRPAGQRCALRLPVACTHGRPDRAPANGARAVLRACKAIMRRDRAGSYAAPATGKQTVPAGKAKDVTRGFDAHGCPIPAPKCIKITLRSSCGLGRQDAIEQYGDVGAIE